MKSPPIFPSQKPKPTRGRSGTCTHCTNERWSFKSKQTVGRLLSLVLTKVADSTTSQLVSDWIVGEALDGIIVPATIKSSHQFATK